jgi:predicted metalloprotease with PDZ domain
MWWWLLGGCATPDPEVARLQAEVADLRSRVEQLEARPASLADELAAMLESGALDLAMGVPDEVAAEQTAPEGVSLAMFDDPEALATMGRMLAHLGPEGTQDGYRISAVRAGSLPARAGIKNGDIVHSLNGRRLGSMDEALAAWEAVKAEQPTALTLELTRRGSPVSLTVPVIPAGTPEEAESMSAADREKRRAELQQRLHERRAQREREQAATTP